MKQSDKDFKMCILRLLGEINFLGKKVFLCGYESAYMNHITAKRYSHVQGKLSEALKLNNGFKIL